ncbi:unnamed protein product [Closterium sp. Yama58-4]|nr:unnamed protein product [Closterium sp. Yama58-4]
MQKDPLQPDLAVSIRHPEAVRKANPAKVKGDSGICFKRLRKMKQRVVSDDEEDHQGLLEMQESEEDIGGGELDEDNSRQRNTCGIHPGDPGDYLWNRRSRDERLDEGGSADAATTKQQSRESVEQVRGEARTAVAELGAVKRSASFKRELANEKLGDGVGSRYTIKLRSVRANFKSGNCLSRRFVLGELSPADVLSMSPEELKDGLTRREKALIAPPVARPGRSECLQWVGIRCSQCNLRGDRQVKILDILNSPKGQQYKLECATCGHEWFLSADAVLAASSPAKPASRVSGAAPPGVTHNTTTAADAAAAAGGAAAAPAPRGPSRLGLIVVPLVLV